MPDSRGRLSLSDLPAPGRVSPGSVKAMVSLFRAVSATPEWDSAWLAYIEVRFRGGWPAGIFDEVSELVGDFADAVDAIEPLSRLMRFDANFVYGFGTSAIALRDYLTPDVCDLMTRPIAGLRAVQPGMHRPVPVARGRSS